MSRISALAQPVYRGSPMQDPANRATHPGCPKLVTPTSHITLRKRVYLLSGISPIYNILTVRTCQLSFLSCFWYSCAICHITERIRESCIRSSRLGRNNLRVIERIVCATSLNLVTMPSVRERTSVTRGWLRSRCAVLCVPTSQARHRQQSDELPTSKNNVLVHPRARCSQIACFI